MPPTLGRGKVRGQSPDAAKGEGRRSLQSPGSDTSELLDSISITYTCMCRICGGESSPAMFFVLVVAVIEIIHERH